MAGAGVLLDVVVVAAAGVVGVTAVEDDGGGRSSAAGDGGASFLGGIRSLIASRPLASANDVILWFGEKPCKAEIQKKKNNLIGDSSNIRHKSIM